MSTDNVQSSAPVRIGLLGLGHLGKIHLRCLLQTDMEVVGVYDTDRYALHSISKEYGVTAYESLDELLQVVDAVDIVTPTTTHHALASAAIKADKHLFIEKPVTLELSEAAELYQMVKDTGIVAQVGHVERYNPALLALGDRPLAPVFIEGHRLATFNPRGTDVSVVLDLMIHDLDLVLSLVDDEVVDVRANGVAIVSETADICNARIEFKGGCVVNLTASRISLKAMRKMRLFQSDAYISIDMLEKVSQVVQLDDLPPGVDRDTYDGMILPTNSGAKRIHIETPPMVENNAILSELNDFNKSIISGSKPHVSIGDGYRALQLAHRIEALIKDMTYGKK